jgi:hypothetical protein
MSSSEANTGGTGYVRFGLEDGNEQHLGRTRPSFTVTRERIRQIEAKALRKLASVAVAEVAGVFGWGEGLAVRLQD